MPRVQALQAITLVEPSTVEKVPAGHMTQALTPTKFVYVPPAHNRHAADEFAAAALEYLPNGHAVHTVPLCSELYCPAAHAVHASEVVEATSVLYAPLGHDSHELAPATGAYAPALHEVQPVDPVTTALYVPTSHSAQAPLL